MSACNETVLGAPALTRSHGLATSNRPDHSPGSDAGAMRVSVARLTLTDFRCYQAQRIEADARPVVLTGANGAGKTNVLEALSFLVPGRGLRGARLGELTRQVPGSEDGGSENSGGNWAVAARIETPDGPVDVGTGRDGAETPQKRERRAVHIDGAPVRAQSAFAEVLSAQWLTPQMDRLFQEGPSARRRFLDRLVFGYDPAHAGRVQAYEHALRERSRLLRHGQPHSGPALPPRCQHPHEPTCRRPH